MSNFYVACDLGAERGRISVGKLNQGKLQLSEVHQFPNLPAQEKDSLHWDIPRLYEEVMVGLRRVASREDPIRGVSCDSWAADYLLFTNDGTLIPPTHHYDDPRAAAGMKHTLSKVPWETIYDETGIQQTPGSTLFQLGAEKSRRLGQATRLMPIADGFNYLLSGEARIEASLASTTQLYNPVQRNWSDRLLKAVHFPQRLLPPVVPSATILGPLHTGITKATGLEDAEVVASCSHDTAAALVGLPASNDVNWAYLSLGTWSHLGMELAGPIIQDESRELNYTNETGYGNTVRFQKRIAGLWLMQECHRFWAEQQQDLDWDIMAHIAGASQPFESLINPADPRFLSPGDMPLKIKAYCKETKQPVPRGPGPIIRCVLESLALSYRKAMKELERLTGRKIERLHLLDHGKPNTLLNHFITNALQVPVVTGPAEAATIGNLLVQAIAFGHVKSLEEARSIVRDSFKFETIQPHALAWNVAYAHFEQLA